MVRMRLNYSILARVPERLAERLPHSLALFEESLQADINCSQAEPLCRTAGSPTLLPRL